MKTLVVLLGLFAACACLAEKLPESLFADMGKRETSIPQERLPFFDADGVYRRPPPEKRAFRSAAVEERIRKAVGDIPDAKLALLFENCFPNTLDTTVSYRTLPDGDDDTFVYTGDIPAMWLRDSSAQVWPYLPFMKDDEPLRRMVRGVVRRLKSARRRAVVLAARKTVAT